MIHPIYVLHSGAVKIALPGLLSATGLKGYHELDNLLVAVGGVPDAGGGGGDSGGEGANGEAEVTTLEDPLVVVAHVCQVVGCKREGDSPGFPGCEFDFVKGTETAHVR